MSKYEDAIGRAQAMIDAAFNNAITTEGLGKYSMTRANTLVGLARVQLELAGAIMYTVPESEPEVQVESASLESLQRMLDDGALKKMLVNDLSAARNASPGATADLMVGIVRGVLRSETPPAASEGDFKPQKLCDVTLAGNRKGPFCGFLKGHAGDHSWAGMVDPSRSRDSDPVPWPKGYEKCGVPGDYNGVCTFNKGHIDRHSWES